MGGAAKKVGGVAEHAINGNPVGKIANASMYGVPGAAASIAQGKNPFNNTPFGGMLGDPKKKVDSTGEVQNQINSTMPDYKSPLDANGNLQDQYKVKAGPAVSAGQVQAGTVKSGTVTSKDVTAGQLDTKALASDPRALNAMRDKALATGPSAWAQLASKEAATRELSAKDAAAQQALSGAATARSQIAMHGGLGGGASERAAMSASRDMNAARQAAQRQGSLDQLNIGMQDESNKNALLGQTAGLDLDTAKYNAENQKFNIGTALDASKFNSAQNLDSQKFNVGSALDASKFNTGLAFDAAKTNAANNLQANEYNSTQQFQGNVANSAAALAGLGGENNFNLGKFQTQMAGYGAAKSGDAIANGGKK